MSNQIDRETFLQVLNYIDNFIQNLPGATSYWMDPKGRYHHTDVGYGLEFWNQVRTYLEHNYEVKEGVDLDESIE